VHRLAMLKLAIKAFRASRSMHGKSSEPEKLHGADTSRASRRMPLRPLLLIVGADAFVGLPKWHRWKELFELAHVVVVTRPGTDFVGTLPARLDHEWTKRSTSDHAALETRLAGAIFSMPVTPQPISATAIRRQLALGPAGTASVQGLLPPAVLTYIDRHQLYRH